MRLPSPYIQSSYACQFVGPLFLGSQSGFGMLGKLFSMLSQPQRKRHLHKLPRTVMLCTMVARTHLQRKHLLSEVSILSCCKWDICKVVCKALGFPATKLPVETVKRKLLLSVDSVKYIESFSPYSQATPFNRKFSQACTNIVSIWRIKAKESIGTCHHTFIFVF